MNAPTLSQLLCGVCVLGGGQSSARMMRTAISLHYSQLLHLIAAPGVEATSHTAPCSLASQQFILFT